jgi:hypothetical protein
MFKATQRPSMIPVTNDRDPSRLPSKLPTNDRQRQHVEPQPLIIQRLLTRPLDRYSFSNLLQTPETAA